MICLWLPLCFSVFVIAELPIFTGYSSLDWYDNKPSKLASLMISNSNLHALECGIMFFSYYIHRIFPKEFSLSRELLMNLIAGWITNSLIDISNSFPTDDNTPRCLFNMINSNFCIDIMRCSLFIIIIYITTISSFSYFPLPYTWVFEDFSKFLFEPKCVRVFLNYIKAKEKDKLTTMKKIMTLYVSEFDKQRLSTMSKNNSSGNNSPTRIKLTVDLKSPSLFQSAARTDSIDVASRVQFLEYIQQMEPSFKRFRKTRSFVALFTRLKNFEDITEHAAINW